MAVVINEFEVVPQAPTNESQATKKENKKSGGNDEPPTDQEVKRMLERRMERLERVSAH
jgi:hypothetical protein